MVGYTEKYLREKLGTLKVVIVNAVGLTKKNSKKVIPVKKKICIFAPMFMNYGLTAF
jgi:hypothetical protein